MNVCVVFVVLNSIIKHVKQCCCTLVLLPKSTLNANLTTTNRFFTNDDWQRGWFENFESDHQYESNLESDVRFEIESNHEASQVPDFFRPDPTHQHYDTTWPDPHLGLNNWRPNDVYFTLATSNNQRNFIIYVCSKASVLLIEYTLTPFPSSLISCY